MEKLHTEEKMLKGSHSQIAQIPKLMKCFLFLKLALFPVTNNVSFYMYGYSIIEQLATKYLF